MTPERFPLLATLDDSALEAFRRRVTVRRVNAGEQLLEEGRENNFLYLVVSGRMEVRKRHRGRELPVGFVAGGDICGEASLLRHDATTATVRGLSESEVLAIPGELIARQYDVNPNFRRAVDRVMERRRVHTALAMNELFSVLPVEVRQSMYHVGEMGCFSTGALLVREHDRDIRRSYLLLDGEAEGTMEVPDGSGEVLSLRRYVLGDQVGEIAALRVPERIATVTALVPTSVFCISNQILHTYRMGNLDFALALYESTRRQLQRQCTLLTPHVGAQRAQEMTVARMVPFDQYRDPQKQMHFPVEERNAGL